MGVVAEKLAGLTVSESSPDGNIAVRTKAGQLQEISFRPGTYEHYTEAGLAHQLARTATLLYLGHERGVQRIMEDAGLHRAADPSQARDETQRRYLEQLRVLSVAGAGPRECVTFEIAGMARWQCRIAGGTLQRLPEREFVAEVAAAAGDLLRKNRFEKALLKNEFFGSKRAELARGRPR